MSEASIHALKVQLESGKLKTDEAYVLSYIKSNTEKGKGTCLIDMEERFAFKTATIVARLSGLEDKGLIFKDGTVSRAVWKNTINQQQVKYTQYYYEPNEFVQNKRRDDVRHIKMKQAARSLYNRFQDKLSMNLKDELIKIITIDNKF